MKPAQPVTSHLRGVARREEWREVVRGRRSEVRGQQSEVGGRRSEVRDRRAEVRGQQSEIRKGPGFLIMLPNILPTSLQRSTS